MRYAHFFVLISLILFQGCGRLYHIKGRILKGVNQRETKIIMLDNDKVPIFGDPVPEALVKLILDLNAEGSPAENTRSVQAICDKNGWFELELYTPEPAKWKLVALEVQAGAYGNLYKTFWDNKDRIEVFYIVLPKNE